MRAVRRCLSPDTLQTYGSGESLGNSFPDGEDSLSRENGPHPAHGKTVAPCQTTEDRVFLLRSEEEAEWEEGRVAATQQEYQEQLNEC